MRLTLQLVSGPAGTSESSALLGFDERGGTIGRAPTNTHVVIDPANRISSQHANIDLKDGCFHLTDLSRNGVYFNEDPEPLGRGNRRAIADGDHIEFGPLGYVAQVTGAPSVDAVRPTRRIDPLAGLQPAHDLPGDGLGDLLRRAPGASDPLAPMPPRDVRPPAASAADERPSPSENWQDLLPAAPASPQAQQPMGQPRSSADPIDDFLAGIADNPALPLPLPVAAAPGIAPQQAQAQSRRTAPAGLPRSEPPHVEQLPKFDSLQQLETFPRSDPLPGIDLRPMVAQPDRLLAVSGPALAVRSPAHQVQPDQMPMPGAMRPSAPFPAGSDPAVAASPHVSAPTGAYARGTVAPRQLNAVGRAALPPELQPFYVELGADIAAIVAVAPVDANDPVEAMRRRAQERLKASRAQSSDVAPVAVAAATASEAEAAERRARRRLDTFWNSLGVDPAAVDADSEEQILAELGRFARVAAEGMVQILSLRRSAKDELRIDQTVIRQVDNNPFKLFANGDAVLRDAVTHRDSAYLPLATAAERGIENLKEHSLIVMVALQAAISAVHARFDPALLEADGPRTGVFFRRPDYRRLWQAYQAHHRNFKLDMDRNARQVMEEAFGVAQDRVGGRK